MKIILPCYNISLELEEVSDHDKKMYESGYSGGTIETSGLKEECPYCNKIDCEGGCKEMCEHKGGVNLADSVIVQKNSDRRNIYNGMMDALESMILAHAVAGIDVCSSAYVEGIETAAESCAHVMED